MATTIFLSPENPPHLAARPECDEAILCLWFETSGSGGNCANRTSMACPKRLKDVFAPHCDRPQHPAK
jgi:hypothetical protein